jgi:hypothetical protein
MQKKQTMHQIMLRNLKFLPYWWSCLTCSVTFCWFTLHETSISSFCVFTEIISHYCFHINSSLVLSYNTTQNMYDTCFINIILGSINSDVMNNVTLSTWQYAQIQEIKLQQNKTEKRSKLVNCRMISLHFVKMHPNFHLSYGILVRKYKNVTITLQTERENPLKVRFCFQTEDKIVIYVSTRGHWDCTTLQHHCTTFGFASGYTEVLQGGTISMPTGRHVDNLYCSVFSRIYPEWIL